MHSHRTLRRSYGDNGAIDQLREQVDEALSSLTGDVQHIDEQLTSLDVFTEELERRQTELVERVERLEGPDNGALKPVVFKRPPAPTDTRPVSRLKRLLAVVLAYCLTVLNTPFAGAAIFSLVVGLVQVSTFYVITAVVLGACALFVGYRRLSPLPAF